MACAPRVEGILKKIPGVETASVDYDSATATVTCTSLVTPEQISEIVSESGMYTVQPKN